jgi:hypothetical protein
MQPFRAAKHPVEVAKQTFRAATNPFQVANYSCMAPQ